MGSGISGVCLPTYLSLTEPSNWVSHEVGGITRSVSVKQFRLVKVCEVPRHLRSLFASVVFVQVQQVDHGLAQELVEAHMSAVHRDDVQRTPVPVARVEERQVERRLFLPHRLDAFLGHGGGELVLGHLHDGVGVVGAILPLGTQVPSLVDRYLDAGGEPLRARGGERHRQKPAETQPKVSPGGF